MNYDTFDTCQVYCHALKETKQKFSLKRVVSQLTGVQIHNVSNKRVFAIKRGYTLQSKSVQSEQDHNLPVEA